MACASTPVIMAQTEPADSAKIHFRRGYRQFDPELGDNAASMSRFIGSVRAADADSSIECIIIRAYASPDGSNSANERLTDNRCNTIAEYIVAETGVDPSLINTYAEGIAWQELRRMVALNDEVPYRDEVLEVLDTTPLWIYDDNNTVVGGRKMSLMNLRGGIPYRWLYDHIFPDLRNAVAMSLYLKADKTAGAATAAENSDYGTGDNALPADETSADTGHNTAESTAADYIPATRILPADPLHRFALKTNLIYDALLCPNLSLEWRIDSKWSVLAEADVAWWKNDPRHKYYQLMYIGAEGRRWFSTRGPWHGMYAGVMAGGGKYDFENGRHGYKGEAGVAGLTFGYMWPINKYLSFDAEIGVGYLYTRYKEYLPYDGHYLYQRTSDTNYFGPVKAQFSLVWRFCDVNRNKKGGNR